MPDAAVTQGQHTPSKPDSDYTVARSPVVTDIDCWSGGNQNLRWLAIALGVAYLVLTIDFARKPITHQSTRRLFGFSILYLLGLFTLIFADCRCSGGIIW